MSNEVGRAGDLGGSLLSTASFRASPSTSQNPEVSMDKARVRVFKRGKYGHANVADGIFRTSADDEECVVDSRTAQQLTELGCCEILEENVSEDEPEAEASEPVVLKAMRKEEPPKRKRGRPRKEPQE